MGPVVNNGCDIRVVGCRLKKKTERIHSVNDDEGCGAIGEDCKMTKSQGRSQSKVEGAYISTNILS